MSVQQRGGRLALVMPDGAAGGLLIATGVNKRVECFEDMESALAYLGTG
jgi:hypothetical protein